VFDTRFDNF